MTMPPVNFTTVSDGLTTSAMMLSKTMDKPPKLLITSPSSEIPPTKWMMVQMPLSSPPPEKTTNSTRVKMLKLRRTSSMTHRADNSPPSTMVFTIIFHSQLTHITKDQRLVLSSNGFHSVPPSAAVCSTNPITMVNQLNSESSTATTTPPNEETSLSKIDEKIKKLWQINNQYFIFIHTKLNKIIII